MGRSSDIIEISAKIFGNMPAQLVISSLSKPLSGLALGSTLLLGLCSLPPAIAKPLQRDIAIAPQTSPSQRSSIEIAGFRPPSNPRPRSGSRTTTGTRQGSCLGSDVDAGFAILGPEDPANVLGRTAATHPTFVWYLPESAEAFPVIFRLLAPNADGKMERVHSETLTYAPGFSSYQLPSTVSALTSGKEYRWQVVVECNPNYPSRSLVQELSFEVVAPPAGIAQGAATGTDLAAVYGEAGLWYEAIAQVAKGNTPAEQQTRTDLLLDLAISLAADNPQLSEDIRNIAEVTAP